MLKGYSHVRANRELEQEVEKVRQAASRTALDGDDSDTETGNSDENRAARASSGDKTSPSAPAPAAAAPAAGQGRALPFWLFAVVIIIEVLDSSSPVARLWARPTDLSKNTNDVIVAQTIAAFVASLARAAFFVFISRYLRGSLAAIKPDYFCIDNLFGRTVVVVLVYYYLNLTAVKTGWVVVVAGVGEMTLNFTLVGHIRVMLKHNAWNEHTLKLYKLQRLYAPALYVMVGITFLFREPGSASKNIFVLYLVVGNMYFYDIYVRAANTQLAAKTSATAPASPMSSWLKRPFLSPRSSGAASPADTPAADDVAAPRTADKEKLGLVSRIYSKLSPRSWLSSSKSATAKDAESDDAGKAEPIDDSSSKAKSSSKKEKAAAEPKKQAKKGGKSVKAVDADEDDAAAAVELQKLENGTRGKKSDKSQAAKPDKAKITFDAPKSAKSSRRRNAASDLP